MLGFLPAVVVHAGGGWSHAAPAGQGRPNRLGLHEGAGNLWEWCRDDWGPAPGDGAVVARKRRHTRLPVSVPVLAVIYVPLCVQFGFSPLATVALIGTADGVKTIVK